MHNISERPEAELVGLAQNGSPDAFAELFRRSRPQLARAACAILDGADEVEDVLQNAACSAYRHIVSFRQDSAFHTWLTAIVVNQARMRGRELRRARLISLDETTEGRAAGIPQIAGAGPNPEEAYAGGELVRVLHQEVRRLPAQLRQIMLLYLEDLSMVDAADRLGLTLAAAKTRLFRARRELHLRMRRYAAWPTAA
ncbi:MAG TPA: sigma-70 family RNA polymerase sigma factor [Candidatus Sulfopaludibacter sp.]|jgi:RNA polymerase sigma-70 factor (ECF subfamily)|nr:sigma-70 family RNA polymerase sigma factor [Candidatus Sulfopaludibacter sp.]